MKTVNWLFGILAFAVIVVFSVILSGAGVAPYIDIPSFIIVYIGGFLLSLMAHGPSGLGAAFRAAVNGGTRGECLAAAEVFKSLSINFLAAGIFGSILGGIAMMAVFTTQKLPAENYTMGAAVAVLTILYALVGILFVSEPFRAAAAARAAKADRED